jgi:hypothetical protein
MLSRQCGRSCCMAGTARVRRSGTHLPPRTSRRVRCWARRRHRRTTRTTHWSRPSPACATAGCAVYREDHRAVIRLGIDRDDNLTALRTQAACDSTPRSGNWWPVAHLDACPRIGPPSCSARCTATRSPRSNATVSPSNSSPTSAASTVTSPRRECRVTDAVMASGTTLLEVHGVGSIVAGVHPRSRR